ncbi:MULTISPECIES: YgaP family membrane protein [Olivibacter]|jgi:hypothetical protein|uniref:DUF2892 domain-containing protein n=3 Tax=Sphingobacteriaceae TaxID=84566 RepID=F4C1W2_SPHS2|nr:MULTISPECIES: DUF2892 domain-containing protein [Olivibacter]MCL4639806.1 DUF2892 domain-containing protein [Olivibacter sp. UJ_SKK_5.1]MDM8174705.1 DUF2892 domain-containing protein [Olivibacter sp. 47]MDX3913541.1 DUF2892 domain-containing protein [Pseudosphingobacterium sp.]QEL01496.1 DUF2892 domain-containing protein [Olivibacter sp. LS-1]
MAHREYLLTESDCTNIEFSERVISIGTGTYMIYKGVRELFKRPLLALGQVAIGSALLYRGATGTCDVKRLIEREYEHPEKAEFV